MSSYTGRHRATTSSSTPTRALATLGTAGTLVVAPLAMATPAQAASSSTWDRLAQCESSGNWQINTGNGYYGGLQFSAATWRGFGGGQYAAYAHQATRSEQIATAEKVLAVQGWGAWPACSRKLGLTRADAAGSPTVTRSVTRTAAPSSSSTAARGSYVVRSGDTLSAIASRSHVAGGWQALYAANRGVIGANPNLIQVGQRLVIPG